jgi:acyl-CoA thioesterase FadM
VKFSYEVFRDADGQLLATGHTIHVICGNNGRPKMLPEKYRQVMVALGVPEPDRSAA